MVFVYFVYFVYPNRESNSHEFSCTYWRELNSGRFTHWATAAAAKGLDGHQLSYSGAGRPWRGAAHDVIFISKADEKSFRFLSRIFLQEATFFRSRIFFRFFETKNRKNGKIPEARPEIISSLLFYGTRDRRTRMNSPKQKFTVIVCLLLVEE